MEKEIFRLLFVQKSKKKKKEAKLKFFPSSVLNTTKDRIISKNADKNQSGKDGKKVEEKAKLKKGSFYYHDYYLYKLTKNPSMNFFSH